MFAKGPMPGSTPKDDALHFYPTARCRRAEAMGIRGYVVELPDGKCLASAGTAQQAWAKAAARGANGCVDAQGGDRK